MAQAKEIKRDGMVEFIKCGRSHGMIGQVKKFYDDREHVKVVIIPSPNPPDPTVLCWRISDVKAL